MGYKFQFITLAGFHALNLAMFELARAYKLSGMSAYSRLQEKEFSREHEYGYEAVKHQQFVGTGYFDAVQQVIASGTASTTALEGSTETAQFNEMAALAHSGQRARSGRRVPAHPGRMPEPNYGGENTCYSAGAGGGLAAVKRAGPGRFFIELQKVAALCPPVAVVVVSTATNGRAPAETSGKLTSACSNRAQPNHPAKAWSRGQRRYSASAPGHTARSRNPS